RGHPHSHRRTWTRCNLTPNAIRRFKNDIQDRTQGNTQMADTKKVFDLIKQHEAKYVDFRFTDPRGKWHHIAQHIATVDEDMLTEGVMFDSSSNAGWKATNESDMILLPDCAPARMDPFAAQPSVVVFCDVLEPLTGQTYSRDPRSVAKNAEAYLKSSGIADTMYVGPEAEFFVFHY